MAIELNFFDTHGVFGMLADYEDRLDHNRLAAQSDDISALMGKLVPFLEVGGDHFSSNYVSFEVTDAQREILSRAFDQRAMKIEAETQRQLDALEELRAKL